ncbi:MAG: alpha-amylase family glycosyl hydrolase [Acidimicrobiales bacterium]
MNDRDRWWETAVFYQIYPRSFADANGDGIGDLAGIRSRLSHLAWLGVDALWLSPIYPSPMADFGYDVADYCDVDPVFGDLAELDALVADAHDIGMRVTLDWVPNHTSDRHPWFVDARSRRDAAKRDWYVWRDPAPDGGRPNNWDACWDIGPAWTFDEATGQYYLHLFLPEQPDLNWANPEVQAAMLDTLRFWLDRGIDGFRADVVHLIGKDPSLPDLATAGTPIISNDHHSTHEHLRRIRSLLDSYAHRPMMVGEVNLFGPGQVRSYHGDDDELTLVFDFRPTYSRWTAEEFRRRIVEVEAEYDDGTWPTWVLGNHDVVRQRTRWGSEARARAGAVFLLTQRGTPYLYAGEELGLPDAEIPADRVVDPGGRDGCRAPVPWTIDAGHGWGADPWLPFVEDAAALSVEAQREDPGSTLHLYRSLLALRRRTPALHRGAQRLLESPEGVVAWERTNGEDRVVVAVNFTSEPRSMDLTGEVLLSSLVGGDRAAQGSSTADAGELGPDEAVIVIPRDH